MKEAFSTLAINLARAGMVPGRDFSYDPAREQLLLSAKAWAWVERIAPGAQERSLRQVLDQG
jgi:hypothetical protein